MPLCDLCALTLCTLCEALLFSAHSHKPPILRILIPLPSFPSARLSRVLFGSEILHRRKSPDFQKNSQRMVELLTAIKNEEEKIRQGGGPKAIESQHKKNRLTARGARQRPHRSRHAIFRISHLRRPRNVRRMGRRPLRRDRHRPRPRLRPPFHGHRQRRHRKSRCPFFR